MNRRFSSAAILKCAAVLLALASVVAASYVAAQKASSQSRGSGARGTARRPRTSAQTRGRREATAAAPFRAQDPNRAPQKLVDDALYTSEEFFGATTQVSRPYGGALTKISSLIEKYPKDARLRYEAATLAEFLGDNDRSAKEMVAYADLKGRSTNALRALADHYHSRAMFADEVRTLQELARKSRVDERGAIYRRAARVVRAYALKQFNPEDFFAELVAADPTDIQPVKDYVQELRLARHEKLAMAVLDRYQKNFPDELAYFLRTRAQINEAAGDRKAAERVYNETFDPVWPQNIASDYYELLRRFGRYRNVRRSLQERVRGGASDLDTVSRLFSIFRYEGNYAQAGRVLRELESRRGQSAAGQAVRGDRWTEKELETAAAMFASIGYYDETSRYLYTLYLVGGLKPGSQVREESLYRLFKVMLDAAGSPTRVAAGDLSLYSDIAVVDQNPGFMNGVLSLILAGSSIPSEFATEEKSAAGYFNRAFAYRIFSSYKQEYAQSSHLGEMYLGVVRVFSSLGEYKLAIESGREFQQRFPDSPSYTEVSLQIADSYVALKDRVNERKVLASLLDKLAASRQEGVPLVPVSSKRWRFGSTPLFRALVDKIRYNIEAYSDTYDPTEGSSPSTSDSADSDKEADNDSDQSEREAQPEPEERSHSERPSAPNYSSVLERYVSSLATEEKKTETLALFWGEIKKHPKEEGLYERFLQWLGQAQLMNEQLKAYNAALREFDSNTWYHRLARWYVRQKRGRELAAYAKQLIDVFDEDEIGDYLYRFGGYGSTAKGDGVDWDQRFAFDLYSYAHRRFPGNLLFVRGMLTYLSKNDRARWEKLASEYYFADRSISDDYLEWLSRKNLLRQRYAEAKQRAGNSAAASNPSPVFTREFGYSVFSADAAMWLSHHDEALDAYRRLAVMYPGNDQISERLAELTRSFGQTSDKLFEESASLYSKLADLFPLSHEYRIKAGEVYAQLGDFKRAGHEWDRLLELEPGERNTYLEVATVYWDYYQYNDAIRVFKQLRSSTGDQTIYAYRMGAVYEGLGDIDSAIVEYVKVLSEPGEGRDTAGKRLAQLSTRQGLAEKIAATYEKARAAAPADWQLVIGYALYQAEREHQADALAMLRTEVSRSSDVAFLETVRDLFRAILRPEDEQQVISRLTTVARDEREAMKYRLQLAAMLERRNKVDEEIGVVDKLVSDFPTNVGVIEESSQFYWRAGLLDKAIDLYKRSIARAAGTNRRAFTLHLAKMQTEANKLSDAEATLRAIYNEDHSDVESFAALARVLGSEKKLDELSMLYQDAFREARESGLGGEESRARIVDLRAGMIKTLDSLGKHDAAVDQYIEIINSYPEDLNRLLGALEYAQQHGLLSRILSYYEKLSKESYKNYRWQLVLGRIYEQQGNLNGASTQYRIAVLNEPERPDLRLNLASVLTRERRYDEAITVLREGWALSGRDPQWLLEVAQIQVRQGQREQAVETVRQALAAKQNASSDARFAVASKLAAWGMDREVVKVCEAIFSGLPARLKDDYVGNGQVAEYVRALSRTEPPAQVFQKLERMRGVFSAIGQNSQDTDGYKARSIVTALDTAMHDDFAMGVIEYASGSESSDLASAITASIAKLNSSSDAPAIRRYLGIARYAGLVEVEEQIQTRLKDQAYDARPKNSSAVTQQDNQYYNELRALVQFYERHARFSRAAEVLSAEQKRDPYKNRFDYDTKIADEYRIAGDSQREVEALRRAYNAASGDLVIGQSDWVERYLTLLYSSGARSELQRIASLYNPYQLQLITFLIDKKEKLLALDAIERARQSSAWTASRSAELGLFLKDSSPEVEPLFRTALGLKPIGQLLGRKSPGGKELVGDDWFVASRNYGYWLGMVGREGDSRKFIPGEIEGHPSSARAQIELASYYLDHKNNARAAEHNQLAAEMEPYSTDVLVLRGRIALANHDRDGALDAWRSIIKAATAPAEAHTYLKVMADNGFLSEALAPLGDFIARYIERSYRNQNGSVQLDSIKPLVREIAERGRGDSKHSAEVATFLSSVVTTNSQDSQIAMMLIDEKLLSDTALAPIYRAVHQRYADAAAAVFGTQQYDDGYYDGNRWSYPAKDLAQFRRTFLDYLIKQRAFDEARLLIATIERERADLRLIRRNSEDDDATYDDGYDWLPLAGALIDLRSEKDVARGVTALRHYCGLDDKAADEDSSNDDRSKTHCLKAYALLMSEHRESDADALLYDSYHAAIWSRYADDATYAGLAELEAKRGRADEAARLLKLITERSTDNGSALRIAADTSTRIGRLQDAIGYREQIAIANPTNSSNKLELARLLAANGRGTEAFDKLASLIEERSSGNTIRAQAAEIVGEIVRADRSLATRATEVFSSRTGEADLLALASIREALADRNGAREVLNKIANGPLVAIAQLKLGVLAVSDHREGDAVTNFERSLQLDADGRITDAIVFRAAGARAQLITLYGKIGRDAAALDLAEGDDSQRESFVNVAVRQALEQRSTAQAANREVAFEPSLEASKPAPGIRPLADMNREGAAAARVVLLASLVESAVRLDRYDRAIALERARVAEASRADQKSAIEKRLAEIISADQVRKLRLASLVRFDKRGATPSIYASKVMGP